MACDDCNASAAWYDLDRAVTSLSWGYLGLLALLVVLAWTLVSKGVITWGDLLSVPKAGGG